MGKIDWKTAKVYGVYFPRRLWEVIEEKKTELGLSYSKFILYLFEEKYGKIEEYPDKEVRFSKKNRFRCRDFRKRHKRDFLLHEKVLNKLRDICIVENETPDRIIESLIMGYEPVPFVEETGKFIYINLGHFETVLKKNPDAMYYHFASKPTLPYKDAVEDYKEGKIDWDVYKEAYLRRLEEDDAQEKIKELKQLVKSRNIYITCVEKLNQFSLAKVLTDYLNGELDE